MITKNGENGMYDSNLYHYLKTSKMLSHNALFYDVNGSIKFYLQIIFLYCELSSNNTWCWRADCGVLIHDSKAEVN